MNTRGVSWPACAAILTMAPVLLLAANGVVLAQGGQGGFGGGGFGGGQGGRAGRALDSDSADGATFTHILTPGDRGEWPIAAREGEVIIVSVSSTVFDPAVEVVDAGGKVLASNDDVRPGVQDARVLFRFPKAGSYKVLVKGFKSAAGGQYTVTIHRFVALDVPIGARTAGNLARKQSQWLRFPAEAGQTLVVTARAASFEPGLLIYSPTGERFDADSLFSAGGRTERVVFRAETKGDYYVRLSSPSISNASFSVTVAIARVTPTTIGEVGPNRTLEPGGLDIWTFPGKAGDLVRIEARAAGAPVAATVEFVPPPAKPGEAAPSEEASGTLVRLPSDPKAMGRAVALLKRNGTYQVTVAQPLGMGTAYTLSSARPEKSWDGEAQTGATLGLGDSDYWALDGTPGQILRCQGAADQFDVSLELYDPNGERIEYNDDGAGSRNALMTALLRERGRYLMRVHAFGDGGSGSYRLRRTVNPVRPLALGVRTDGDVGSGSEEIWSFTGKAGQTVIISARSSEFDTYVRLFGPDGLETATGDDGGEGTDSLMAVKLPLEGIYTLWVSPKSGAGKYSLRVMDAD
jgi:hypothetical protein